jgi:hypothetical protein
MLNYKRFMIILIVSAFFPLCLLFGGGMGEKGKFFVLQEIGPSGDVKPAKNDSGNNTPATPPPTLVVSGIIVEVKKDSRGVPKEAYIKLGYGTAGIKKGLKGIMFNDSAQTQRIGRIEISQVVSREYSVGTILELTHQIKTGEAVAAFEVPK